MTDECEWEVQSYIYGPKWRSLRAILMDLGQTFGVHVSTDGEERGLFRKVVYFTLCAPEEERLTAFGKALSEIARRP